MKTEIFLEFKVQMSWLKCLKRFFILMLWEVWFGIYIIVLKKYIDLQTFVLDAEGSTSTLEKTYHILPIC